jgi:hypothetical protein
MKQLILSIALVFLAASPVWAQSYAGKAVMVVGRAVVTDANGAERRLQKGDTVFAGETISTARHTYVNVLYRDEGRTLVGPNSQLRIDEFSYEEALPAAGPRSKGSSNSLKTAGTTALSLLKGSLRAVTGLIGKTNRENYSVSTLVATIGIRGTDFIVVQCDEQCDAMGPAPEGTNPKGGSVVGVYDGGVGVTNQDGNGVELGKDAFLLVTSAGEFVPLAVPPEFLLLTPLDDPQECE